MREFHEFSLVVVLLSLTAPAASAGIVGEQSAPIPSDSDYTVLLLSEQQTSVEVLPGDTVPVDIVLHRNRGPQLYVGAAVFYLHVSNGGLLFEDYLWDSAYFDTGDPNDNSTRPTDPPSVIETIHFENITVLGDHLFDRGTILSLDLGVPEEARPGSSYEVSYENDTLTENCLFCFYTAEQIAPLTINVVPEPGTVVLVGVGGLALWRHRRRPVPAGKW